MKAQSAVLVSTHRPLSLFGLAPPLLLISFCGGLAVALALISAQVLAPVLPAFITVSGAMWVTFFRRSRQDSHFAQVLILAPRFWAGRKGRSGRRFLVRGRGPQGREGARR